MDRREEDLINLTRKGAPDVASRVTYTLGHDPAKYARAIASVMGHLHAQGIISDDDLDSMLLYAAGPPLY